MNKLNVFIAVILLLAGISCVTMQYENWNSSMTYHPKDTVSYRGGVWECTVVTHDEPPGFLESDSGSSWRIVSGTNWHKPTVRTKYDKLNFWVP